MKKFLFNVAWAGFILVFFLAACNNSKSDGCQDLCHKLEEGYQAYLKQLVERDSLRSVLVPKMVPISEELGKHYYQKFQDEFTSRSQPQTHHLKIPRGTIEFWYKYMLNNNTDTLAFAFAKYDTTGFANAALRDTMYNSRSGAEDKMKNKFSIIVGEWDAKQRGIKVFRIPGKAVGFFDDWHNEDP